MEKKFFIGVPTGESARTAEFYDYYNLMHRPNGSICSFSHGQSPAKNRNVLIDLAKENNCTHILLLDDDMAPQVDLLDRLASHDKDVVSGLYLMRKFPHLPVIFDEHYSDGQCRFQFLNNQITGGLLEVVNCGFGAVLIDMKVFEKLEKPYITLGGIFTDEWCDDIVFFNKVREAGFKIYCDLDARVGHHVSCFMYPEKTKDGWITQYKHKGGIVTIPQHKYEPIEVV